MIIGASSFASPLSELYKEVESIELYVPKLRLYRGRELVEEHVRELLDIFSTSTMLTSIHAPYYGDSPNYPDELMVDTAHMGKAQFRIMEECIDLARQLGSCVVVVHPGKIIGDREWCFARMVRNLQKLAATADDCGVVLGLENKEGTDPTNLCCTAEEQIRAIKEVDSESLKATFDIGHANLTCSGDGGKLRKFIRNLNNSVVHVHVHDNNGMLTGKYFGDMHGVPGEGNIDFSLLKELPFNGVYNLEVFSMEVVRIGKRVLETMNSSR
jgi:sugar phosphate isomerase/epimerase